jgi:hypothetical protein
MLQHFPIDLDGDKFGHEDIKQVLVTDSFLKECEHVSHTAYLIISTKMELISVRPINQSIGLLE